MAARKNRIKQTQATRDKIQATQLINRLTNHALADEEIMTSGQVNAAKILLGKTIPDVSSVDVNANVDAELTITRKVYTPSN